jgi:adenylate cyclase
MPALIYKPGSPGERVFPLKLGLNGVGRERGNAVLLNRPDISRHHAEIAVTPERVILKDLGSSNHSFVNGRKVKVTELSDGDEVRFATLRFSFRIADDASSTAEADRNDTGTLSSDMAEQGGVEDRVTPERRAELEQIVADMSVHPPGAGSLPSLLRLPEGWPADQRLARLQVLLDVANRLSAPSGVAERMSQTVDLVLAYLAVDSVAVLELLAEQDSGNGAGRGANGDDALPAAGTGLQPRELAAGRREGAAADTTNRLWEPALAVTALAKSGPALSIDDVPDSSEVRVELCLPLGQLTPDAVLCVASDAVSRPYGDEDLAFIASLAEQASIALANARALDALREDETGSARPPQPPPGAERSASSAPSGEDSVPC